MLGDWHGEKIELTMNRYALYCTAEQTKKAIELGAPIEKKEIQLCDNAKHFFWYDGFYYNYPTAEEMIGWLEEQESICSIEINNDTINKVWMYFLYTNKEETTEWKSLFPSRKEATLAAIDAALDYLSNNK